MDFYVYIYRFRLFVKLYCDIECLNVVPGIEEGRRKIKMDKKKI